MRKYWLGLGVAVLVACVSWIVPGKALAADACVTAECHAQMGKAQYVHGPIGAGMCSVCHAEARKGHPNKDKKNPDFKLVAVGKALCDKCHQEKPVDRFEFKHTPVKRGECIGCHDPHQSDAPKQLKKKKTSDLCYMCHKNTQQVKKFLHGPVASGDCNVCHNPHSSPNPHQLEARGNDACFLCHEDRKAEFTRKSVHKPVTESCANCHDSHSSGYKFLLKNDTVSLCFSCHTKIQEHVKNAKVQHGAIKQGTCTACHTPHSSDYVRQLKLSTKQICYSCHKEIGSRVLASKSLHGPVQQDDCYACHDTHGSDNTKILKKYFPAEFYMEYKTENYAICWDCHNKDMALTEVTTTLTGFRNGSRNLHYFHVNQKKGRSCKACHEMHAGDQEKHIRDKVPFGTGGWQLPVNYTKLATGGRCNVGCHKEMTYDRESPAKN
jgi:predicted CXXCH cytochrome family protein